MFQQVMLHDEVVAVSIDAYITVVGEAEVQDVAEYVMHLGVTGYAVHHMIGHRVVHPLTLIDLVVSRVGRGAESEIRHRPAVVHDDKATLALHVLSEQLLRRVVPLPLFHITRGPHDAFGRSHNLHDVGNVRRSGLADCALICFFCHDV